MRWLFPLLLLTAAPLRAEEARPFTYADFEQSVDHLDLAICPEPLAGPDRFCRFTAHADGLKAALTVEENLRFWAAIHGTREVEQALAGMDLLALRDRRAANLSAGQKRRLGLARLLVTGRAVWLLDEPTVSLDAASVALFAGVVRGHLAGGGAVLAATHIDLGLAEAEVLDLSPFRAKAPAAGGRRGDFDEAFA